MLTLFKSVFITLLFFIITNRSEGQNKQTENVIQVIGTEKNSIPIFGKKLKSNFLPLAKPFDSHIQRILKTNNSIYCFIDGTGQLFQFIDSTRKFKRIDSTHFWGYNLGSFAFTYNNAVYNLGGTGLWRSNGHLRRFNFIDHEWDIIPLNKELPIISGENEGLIYFDPMEGIIYSAYNSFINDGVKSSHSFKNSIQFEVMKLNLNTKEWQSMGYLNSELLQKDITQEKNIAITPMGLLTGNNIRLSLWNFKENKLFELTNSNPKFQYLKRGIDTTFVHFKMNHLYLIRENKIDSFKLSLSDFRLVGKIYKIHTFDILKKYIYYIYSIIIFLVLMLLAITYKTIRIKKSKSIEIAGNNIVIFKQQEMLLLDLLIINYRKDLKTTIEEINLTLGLNSRSVETQKSQRHKVITSINDAYNSKTGRKLIYSEKLDFDRRSNVYYIPKEEMNTLLKFIPKD